MTGVLKILVNGVWTDAVEPGPPGVKGSRGPPGPTGLPGARGAAGDTVPVGGLPGEYLRKTGPADFEAGWQSLVRTGPIQSKEMRGPWDGINGGSRFDVVLEARDYVVMANAAAQADTTGGKYIMVQLDGVKAPTLPTHPGPYIRLYFNVITMHQVMGTCTFDLIYGRDFLVAGKHVLSLVTSSGGTTANGEDWGHIVVFPQPLP